jgi:hypothetical protein
LNVRQHPLGGTQTEFTREDGKKILRIDNGWECCPHDYILLDKNPYEEVKDG